MSRWVTAVLALVALAPLASAQVPEPPDPGAVVEAVCGVAPVDLPVCPREEPAGPPPQAPDEHDPQAAPAPPGAPQDGDDLAAEAQEEVQGIVEDPDSAPGRVASLVATVVQFVKDLLGLPAQGVARLDAARVELAASVGGTVEGARGGLARAADAAGGALAGVRDALAGLFAGDAAPVREARGLPRDAPEVDGAAGGLLEGALQRVPSPMAR